MDRRLTTILAADLAGYSRMMAADEEGVVERVRQVRREVIDPAVAEGGGRIVKTMGDGLLVEFSSPVEAVRTALTVQKDMLARERAEPEDNRLRFRVGVNLGDVIVDGDDLLGDAVNVAARLESLAPVGGLCISRAVFDQAKGRVDAEMTALGPKSVKNLPSPVEVWRVEIPGIEAPKAKPRHAERPSVAVLPFDNMSSDPDQDFLADGVVEDVITELSKFRSLKVIARNSTFVYKGVASDIRKIGEELDARYVVEGSVRRSGNRLRLTAQLIEAETGAHLWANRWDRTVDNLFELQDELTQAIVTSVEPEMGAHERHLARIRPTSSLTAWEHCQRGISLLSEYSEQTLNRAEEDFVSAIEADESFALPRALLARLYFVRAIVYRPQDQAAEYEHSVELARQALALDERLETAHAVLGVALSMLDRPEESDAAIRTAVALNPNSAFCRYAAGLAQLHRREPDWQSMITHGEAALSLSPMDPSAHSFQNVVTQGRLIGTLDYADPGFIASARAATRHKGAPWYVHLIAAAAEVASGNETAAQQDIAQALKLAPGMTMKAYRKAFSFYFIEKYFEMGDATGVNQRLIELGLPEG